MWCGHTRKLLNERIKTMRTFTIENDSNNITIHASDREAEAVLDAERFASEAELASLASTGSRPAS